MKEKFLCVYDKNVEFLEITTTTALVVETTTTTGVVMIETTKSPETTPEIVTPSDQCIESCPQVIKIGPKS